MYKYNYQSQYLRDYYGNKDYIYEGNGVAYLQYLRLSTKTAITIKIDDELCLKFSKGSYSASSKATFFTPIGITDDRYQYLATPSTINTVLFTGSSYYSELLFGNSYDIDPMNDIYYAIDYPLRFKKKLEVSFTGVSTTNVVSFYIKVYYTSTQT